MFTSVHLCCRTGEVVVQNYNAVLTLSHLYQSSDAVLVLENDHLQRICKQLLGIQQVVPGGLRDLVEGALSLKGAGPTSTWTRCFALAAQKFAAG